MKKAVGEKRSGWQSHTAKEGGTERVTMRRANRGAEDVENGGEESNC